MKRLSILVLATMMCLTLALGIGAFAADTTASLLGTWEVEVPEYGTFLVKIGNNGVGQMYLGEEPAGEFSFMVRNNVMVSIEADEDGKPVVESTTMEFPDENTMVGTEGGMTLTFKRIEASTDTEIVADNPFIGTWIADLPEVAGMSMTYKANGTYTYEGGEFKGECSYLVKDQLMVSVGDEGEAEQFTFVVVDESTMDVTEAANGVVVQFKRVADIEVENAA